MEVGRRSSSCPRTRWYMRSARLLPGVALLASASVVLALLHGCQDAQQPAEPDPAASTAPVASPVFAVQGKWAAAFATPVVAVDLHALPTGKVLLWGDPS